MSYIFCNWLAKSRNENNQKIHKPNFIDLCANKIENTELDLSKIWNNLEVSKVKWTSKQ